MIIRNIRQCSVAVKCQLLLSLFNISTLTHLKVPFNRIFRTQMGQQHRTKMSKNLIKRGLDPFKVIIRKLISSLRTRIMQNMGEQGKKPTKAEL